MIENNYKLFVHPLEELMAKIVDENCIRFFFNKTDGELTNLLEKQY